MEFLKSIGGELKVMKNQRRSKRVYDFITCISRAYGTRFWASPLTPDWSPTLQDGIEPTALGTVWTKLYCRR